MKIGREHILVPFFLATRKSVVVGLEPAMFVTKHSWRESAIRMTRLALAALVAIAILCLPAIASPLSETGAAAATINAPIVGIAADRASGGYWMDGADGGVFAFGAPYDGSAGNLTLNKPIVGMAATGDGQGYWQVASDGGVFSYGNATFHGSTGSLTLNRPVVGMASTPDGGGYWLVASDGGIFSFGDAHYYGSTGSLTLNRPVVGMASTPDGRGYWLVASDGGIFSYGSATYYGSTGSITLNKPVVGMASTPDGGGYWLVASDGGIFSLGNASYKGSIPGGPANSSSSSPTLEPNPSYEPPLDLTMDGCPVYSDTISNFHVLAAPPTGIPVVEASTVQWQPFLYFYNSSGQWQYQGTAGKVWTSGIYSNPIYIPGSPEWVDSSGQAFTNQEFWVQQGYSYLVAGKTSWLNSQGSVVAYNYSFTPYGCNYT